MTGLSFCAAKVTATSDPHISRLAPQRSLAHKRRYSIELTSSSGRAFPDEDSEDTCGAGGALFPCRGVCARCRRDPASSPEKHPDRSWGRLEVIFRWQGWTSQTQGNPRVALISTVPESRGEVGPVVHARSSQSDSEGLRRGVCRTSALVGRSAGFALETAAN
jgi:hypothetical protein